MIIVDRLATENDLNNRFQIQNEFINIGADIHAGNDYALRWASENGQLEIVKYLVSMGADIHAKNDYALCYASKNGHLEIVKYLKEHSK